MSSARNYKYYVGAKKLVQEDGGQFLLNAE
jgi:hypothetical protein